MWNPAYNTQSQSSGSLRKQQKFGDATTAVPAKCNLCQALRQCRQVVKASEL